MSVLVENSPRRGGPAKPKIAARNLGLRYASDSDVDLQPAAIQELSFEVGNGEFVAIIGPSGCGKSTLLKVVAGLLKPSSGTVEMDGAPVEQVPKGIGFLFQFDALLPWKTSRQNVEIGAELGGADPASAKAVAISLLEELGLGKSLDKFPAELSGGMRKRVALARTLAYSPTVFLLDEPFSALDAQTRIQVGNRFLDIFQKRDQSVVLVTHDIEEAIAMADRVIVMTAAPGTIAAEFVVDLPRPRDYYASRFEPRFRELQAKAWDVLRFQMERAAT
jgi:NitT/TauT family transport system ATP-binding protein